MSEYAAKQRRALPDAVREGLRAHAKRLRPAPVDILDGRESPFAPSKASTQEAGTSTRVSFSAAGFLTQILGQTAGSEGAQGLRHNRDGPTKGSDAYRRAGGEPAVYPSSPTVFRIAV